MYLLGRELGYPAQDELVAYVTDRLLLIHFQTEMRSDGAVDGAVSGSPMDLADASLVVAAETLGLRRVFTLDRHFYAYRLADGSALEVVP